MFKRHEMRQVKDLPENRRREYDSVRNQATEARNYTNKAMTDYANNNPEEAQKEMRLALNVLDSLIKHQLNEYSFKVL